MEEVRVGTPSGFPDRLDMRYERKDALPQNFALKLILGFKTEEEYKRPLGGCPLLAFYTSACNFSQVKLTMFALV